MVERFLLLSILLLQLMLSGTLLYVCYQIDQHVLAPATRTANSVRDAATILTHGPIGGALYAATHPKARELWSSASAYISAAAGSLRKREGGEKDEI